MKAWIKTTNKEKSMKKQKSSGKKVPVVPTKEQMKADPSLCVRSWAMTPAERERAGLPEHMDQ